MINRRRNTKTQYNKPNIVRFSAAGAQSWTVPANCGKIDLFLVGAGGAGGRWVNWGYSCGGSGGGGECVTVKNISVLPGQVLYYNIGIGGIGGSTSNGADWGNTVVTLNGNTYTAVGGKGGKTAIPNSTISAYLALIGEGGNPGINGGCYLDYNTTALYMKNGSIYPTGYYGTTTINARVVYLFRGGIPEFNEEGNPTHAAGGCMEPGRIDTSYTINKGADSQSGYTGTFCGGGGGFGGGGAGAMYSQSTTVAGGNGGVVIRYWTTS